jgi:hypothetical protein
MVSVMLDVLREGFELGLLEEFAEGALAVPVGGEVFSVVFTQVFDLRGGMLVIDLPVFVTGTTVEAWIFGAVAHIGSLTAIEGLLV